MRYSRSLSKLGELLERADLTSALDDKMFTLFAPHNDAFKKMLPLELKAMENNKPQLTKVLQRHIISGRKIADDGFVDTKYQTSNTAMDIIQINQDPNDRDKQVISFNETKSRHTTRDRKDDIIVGKGIIHIIDTVLLEGILTFISAF